MAEQDCGCTIARHTVSGQPRDEVRLCPTHTAARQVRLALECVYTLSTLVPRGNELPEAEGQGRRAGSERG